MCFYGLSPQSNAIFRYYHNILRYILKEKHSLDEIHLMEKQFVEKKVGKEFVYFKITIYLCTRKSEMMAG